MRLPQASGPATQVAAGEGHSLALTSTGQLYAFGSNEYGQLGTLVNSGTREADPEPTLVDVPGATGQIVQIAAGRRDSLAVTSTGQLFAWGDNEGGQLGTTANSGRTRPPAVAKPNPIPTLVSLPAGATVDTVARGPFSEHTLALIADLAVSSASLTSGQVGVRYTASAEATGGSGPYTWSASGLPAGLGINAQTGQIEGTPTTSGSSSVALTVVDSFGITATSAPISLTVAPPSRPAIAKIKPNHGPRSGGTKVTITGTGFSGATEVNFGARRGTSLEVVSDNEIRAVSPPGKGRVAVTVTTADGTSATIPADDFSYVRRSKRSRVRSSTDGSRRASPHRFSPPG